MRIAEIKYGQITAHLSHEDCRHLAYACQVAADNTVTQEEQVRQTYLDTAGAAFISAGMAAFAQFRLLAEDRDALAEQFPASYAAAG